MITEEERAKTRAEIEMRFAQMGKRLEDSPRAKFDQWIALQPNRQDCQCGGQQTLSHRETLKRANDEHPKACYVCPKTCELSLAKRPEWLSMGIPLNAIHCGYVNFAVDHCEPLTSLRLRAHQWGADPKGVLTLVGGTGVGKDHLAIAIAKQQRRFQWVTWEDYVTGQKIWSREKKNSFLKTKLLIISELKNLGTSREQLVLEYLIDRRYRDKTPTVITTNETNSESLRSYVGDRIFSRLLQEASRPLMFDNVPDYRDR